MKPSEKLAQSLEVLHNLQKQGKYAIQSKDHLKGLTFPTVVSQGLYTSNDSVCPALTK